MNPFEKMQQAQVAQPAAPLSRANVGAGGPKKLTWSERQALAKKQQEEEEERSRQASAKAISPASTGTRWGAPAVGAGVGAAAAFAEETAPPPPPPAPPMPNTSRPIRPPVTATEPELEEETSIPPVSSLSSSQS